MKPVGVVNDMNSVAGDVGWNSHKIPGKTLFSDTCGQVRMSALWSLALTALPFTGLYPQASCPRRGACRGCVASDTVKRRQRHQDKSPASSGRMILPCEPPNRAGPLSRGRFSLWSRPSLFGAPAIKWYLEAPKTPHMEPQGTTSLDNTPKKPNGIPRHHNRSLWSPKIPWSLKAPSSKPLPIR